MRRFYLENDYGSRLPLNGESGLFLSTPTGLGVNLAPSYADLQKGFFRNISGDTEPQMTVTCDLVFLSCSHRNEKCSVHFHTVPYS